MLNNLAEKFNPEPDHRTCGHALFERLGGRKTLDRVHKRFYDKIYAHPVLGAFFVNSEQEYQESQQSDFLTAEFGGPEQYRGRLPDGAHQHMFITEELFELRHKILAETLDECGVEAELCDRWLAVDQGFRSLIVKETLDQCEKRYGTDKILVAPGT